MLWARSIKHILAFPRCFATSNAVWPVCGSTESAIPELSRNLTALASPGTTSRQHSERDRQRDSERERDTETETVREALETSSTIGWRTVAGRHVQRVRWREGARSHRERSSQRADVVLLDSGSPGERTAGKVRGCRRHSATSSEHRVQQRHVRALPPDVREGAVVGGLAGVVRAVEVLCGE